MFWVCIYLYVMFYLSICFPVSANLSLFVSVSYLLMYPCIMCVCMYVRVCKWLCLSLAIYMCLCTYVYILTHLSLSLCVVCICLYASVFRFVFMYASFYLFVYIYVLFIHVSVYICFVVCRSLCCLWFSLVWCGLICCSAFCCLVSWVRLSLLCVSLCYSCRSAVCFVVLLALEFYRFFFVFSRLCIFWFCLFMVFLLSLWFFCLFSTSLICCSQRCVVWLGVGRFVLFDFVCPSFPSAVMSRVELVVVHRSSCAPFALVHLLYRAHPSIHVCIYVTMYPCLSAFLYSSISCVLFIYIYTFNFICVRLFCASVYLFVCMSLSIYICMYWSFMFLRIYISVSVYPFVYLCVCTYLSLYISVCFPIYICALLSEMFALFDVVLWCLREYVFPDSALEVCNFPGRHRCREMSTTDGEGLKYLYYSAVHTYII